MLNQEGIRAVIFDLDGTLVDTAPDFVIVVNQLLNENDRPPLHKDVIRQYLSYGAGELVRIAFGIDQSHEDFDRLKFRLLELYTLNFNVLSRPFPGIETLIGNLAARGIVWGVATHKPAMYAIPLMSRLNILPSPQCVICPEDVSMRKPHPDSLFLACAKIGCDPSEIIFIGDHRRDIECGKRAGCITISAAYGYIGNEENVLDWGADHCVANVDSIWNIITDLQREL